VSGSMSHRDACRHSARVVAHRFHQAFDLEAAWTASAAAPAASAVGLAGTWQSLQWPRQDIGEVAIAQLELPRYRLSTRTAQNSAGAGWASPGIPPHPLASNGGRATGRLLGPACAYPMNCATTMLLERSSIKVHEHVGALIVVPFLGTVPNG
jgi:hypothetical protein